MACGKPPNPDRMTPPSALAHPSVQPALEALLQAERAVSAHPPGVKVDAAIARAMRLVELACRPSRTTEVNRKRLEAKLERIKGFAQSRLRDNVSQSAEPRAIDEKAADASWVMEKFGTVRSSKRTHRRQQIGDLLGTFGDQLAVNGDEVELLSEELPIELAKELQRVDNSSAWRGAVWDLYLSSLRCAVYAVRPQLVRESATFQLTVCSLLRVRREDIQRRHGVQIRAGTLPTAIEIICADNGSAQESVNAILELNALPNVLLRLPPNTVCRTLEEVLL